MLDTVRAAASLELAAAGERDDAMEGLVRYCTTQASRARVGLTGPAQLDWLNRVREDLENHRGALAWLIDHGRPADAADIAWGLKYFWLIRGHAAEGVQWYEQILNLPALPPAAELRALAGVTVMWYTQGELARAAAGLSRARALTHDAVDTDAAAHVEYLSGHVEHASGHLEAARARFRSSVEQFQALANPAGTGNALSGLAAIAVAGARAYAAGQKSSIEPLNEEIDSITTSRVHV